MRRLFVVATLLFVSACGDSPSSPTQPPPASSTFAPPVFADFSGYWSGTFIYQQCPGGHCSLAIERNARFSLRLRQVINHVNGVFDSEYTGSIVIEGDVQPDGALVLSGSEETGGTAGARGRSKFTAPALRLDSATGLTGTMRYDDSLILGPIDSRTSVAEGPIVSATRQNLDAYIADLSGTWKGRYLVRDCADETGRPFCGLFVMPGYVEYLELRMAVDGSAASGELIPVSSRIPVGGAARGRTIELAGGRDEQGGRFSDRVTSLTASVDDYGRLRGSFSYVHIANGVTSTAKVDLVQMVKKP